MWKPRKQCDHATTVGDIIIAGDVALPATPEASYLRSFRPLTHTSCLRVFYPQCLLLSLGLPRLPGTQTHTLIRYGGLASSLQLITEGRGRICQIYTRRWMCQSVQGGTGYDSERSWGHQRSEGRARPVEEGTTRFQTHHSINCSTLIKIHALKTLKIRLVALD